MLAQEYETGHTPPWSPEAEVSVLGAMLIDPDAVAEARSILRPDDFFREAHRHIFRAISEMAEDGDAVDVIMLKAALDAAGKTEQAGGMEYLAELLDAVPTGANVAYHARVVLQRARLRRLIDGCQQTIREALSPNGTDPDAIIARAEERVFSVAEDRAGTQGFQPTNEAIWGAMELIERESKAEEGLTGVPTGIPRLDRMTAGFQPGDLIIVAGRPSHGKSALAWGMTEYAAGKGHASAIYSLEMSKEEMVKRGLAQRADLDLMKIRRGELSPDDYKRLSDAAGWIDNLPLFLDDHPSERIAGLRAELRRLLSAHPIKLLTVDYMQLMSEDAESRRVEVGKISRGLKGIARDFGISVVALSQLSRACESRSPPRPVLSDLRESGDIEQDADVVLMLWRPEMYFDDKTPNEEIADLSDRGELIVAKQRNGPTGSVWLHFQKSTTRFRELDRHSPQHLGGSA